MLFFSAPHKGAKYLITLNAPFKLISICFSKSFTDCLNKGPGKEVPALLTKARRLESFKSFFINAAAFHQLRQFRYVKNYRC